MKNAVFTATYERNEVARTKAGITEIQRLRTYV
jgi:hypothetical protein